MKYSMSKSKVQIKMFDSRLNKLRGRKSRQTQVTLFIPCVTNPNNSELFNTFGYNENRQN